jgi:hypothetical protein
MADFSTNIPELGTGGPSQNIPVSSGQLASGALGNVASDASSVLGGILEGRQMHQRMLIQQMTGSAEADLVHKQSALADAVASGQMSSAFARTQARAITNQAIANNPVLTDQLMAVHKSFMDTPGLGQDVGHGTQQENEQVALNAKAQADGYGSPDMAPADQAKFTVAWQQVQQGQSALKVLQDKQNYVNSQLDQTKLQGDIRNSNQAFVTGGIQQQTDRLVLSQKQDEVTAQHALTTMASGYGANLVAGLNKILDDPNTQKDPATALAKVDSLTTSLQQLTMQASPGNGAQFKYLNDIAAPFHDMIQSVKDQISGKTTGDITQQAINNAQSRVQLTSILSHPKAAATIANSNLIKNSMVTVAGLNNAAMDMTTSNADPATPPANLAHNDPDQVQGAKAYSKLLLDNINTLQNGSKPANPDALKADISTHVDQLLKGVNAYQLAVQNPQDYNTIVDTLANPTFGKYMKETGGTLHSSSAVSAKSVLQSDYQNVVLPLMRNEYFNKVNDEDKQAAGGPNAVASGYVPNMQQPEDNTPRVNKIVPVFNGSGVTFIPRDDNPDPATIASVRDLNRNVSDTLNKLIRMDAHLSGNTDYKGVWEKKYEPLFENEAPKTNPNEAPVNSQQGSTGAVDYGKMSHSDLVNLRNSLPKDDPRQAEIAPYEHQAFAREWVKEDPVTATASLLGAIPAYSAAKAVGVVKSRTPASFDEIASAYKGIGQGLGLVD